MPRKGTKGLPGRTLLELGLGGYPDIKNEPVAEVVKR